MKGIKSIAVAVCMALLGWFAFSAGSVSAAAKGKLLFIPHDNRPISGEESADVVRAMGYEVIMPPQELLSGGTEKPGRPDALWAWAREHVRGAQAAVISSDAMIYGGLVPSRKHEIPEQVLSGRAAQFARLRQENPGMRLYAFGSLMRTPVNGAAAGQEEPPYYQEYGADLFRVSALEDKAETVGLDAEEKQELARRRQAVPADVRQDWLARRDKNLSVSRRMIDLTRQGVFSYFVIGKDDNAPLSQTHREGRMLEQYAVGLPETKFQLQAGIDEFGVLLLSRAVNDIERQIPFIYARYNEGMGADTVPSYSDSRIGASVRAAVLAAGGMMVRSPERADLVMLVNTNKDGRTGEANVISPSEGTLLNDGQDRAATRAFVRMVKRYAEAGRPVGIADIAFANGADNALMRHLRDEGLLYRIRSYAGWNTATNSTGFAIGMGLLSTRMSDEACDRLLTRRYLEDWGYQANVRTGLAADLAQFRRPDVYANPGSYETGITARITSRMRQFAARNLPPYSGLDTLRAVLPWHRLFEVDFH